MITLMFLFLLSRGNSVGSVCFQLLSESAALRFANVQLEKGCSKVFEFGLRGVKLVHPWERRRRIP